MMKHLINNGYKTYVKPLNITLYEDLKLSLSGLSLSNKAYSHSGYTMVRFLPVLACLLPQP